MQPLYVTAYGNGKGLFGQPLMEMEKDCLGSRLRQQCLIAYGNSVLQLTATVSYSLRQQCLTAYGNSVLQLTAIVSYSLRQQCLTAYCNSVLQLTAIVSYSLW